MSHANKPSGTQRASVSEAFSFWKRFTYDRIIFYILGVLAVAGTNVVDVAIPKLIQLNIDALQQNQRFEVNLFAILLITYVLQFFCRVLWRRTLARQSFKAGAILKSTLWEKLRFLPLSTFHKKLTRGEVINYATGDVTNAQNAFGFHFIASTDFIFLTSLSVLMMSSISLKLTLISLLVFPLIPFFIYFLCQKEAQLYEESQVSLSKLNDTVDSIVGASKLMKLRPHAPLWNQRLTQAALNYQEKRKELLSTEAKFFPATALPPALSIVFFLIFGLKEYQAGLISLGDLVAFHAYLFMIADPLSELGWMISDWQKSFGSLQRILGVFKEKIDPIFKSKDKAHKNALPILIKDLSFSFDGTQNNLFIPHLELKKRERLGIAGDVGSGKSTLGRILAGLELHYTGQVELFGCELKKLSAEELRSKVALVDQNPFLFGTSIRENLSLNKSLTDEELWHWLEVVDLVDDFKKIPNALDSHLGEWGINLSGGQRQRLTLARALCKKPELIILDDTLSAVDVVTEKKILSRLEKALGDLSVVLISHRESSLALCHRRLFLRGHS